MRNVFLVLMSLIISNFSFADQNNLTLKERQPIAELELTSVTVEGDRSVINAESQMGVYGRVYMTFILSSGVTGDNGTYTFEGRGYVDKETAFTGTGVGVWHREGSNLIMDQLINISDGTVNFDRVVMNPLERTATLAVYALK